MPQAHSIDKLWVDETQTHSVDKVLSEGLASNSRTKLSSEQACVPFTRQNVERIGQDYSLDNMSSEGARVSFTR